MKSFGKKPISFSCSARSIYIQMILWNLAQIINFIAKNGPFNEIQNAIYGIYSESAHQGLSVSESIKKVKATKNRTKGNHTEKSRKIQKRTFKF